MYSSNWTEMNLKCKKLILLTMMMNNAHQKKLKFTSQNIVNMEMFSRVRTTNATMIIYYFSYKTINMYTYKI